MLGLCSEVSRRTVVVAVLAAAFMLSSVAGAHAAEPVPFASASAPCGSGPITFPIQSVGHPDAIYWFRSIGATGDIGGGSGLDSTAFAAGDNGWEGLAIEVSIEAGTAPEIPLSCTGGSVEAKLAERPSTPATFSAEITPGFERAVDLPFIGPGGGHYAVSITLLQGAVEIDDVNGIIQSSGEYALRDTQQKGANWITVTPVSGPTAIFTATVKLIPVAINALAFKQSCIAPGTGVPATYSLTGETTLSASVLGPGGSLVRTLGTFPAQAGQSSIPWDGRNSAGAGVPSGTYALNLLSVDPQGDPSAAQALIYIDSSPPTVALSSPAQIGPTQSVGFQVSDPGCGTKSAQVAIEPPEGDETVKASYGEFNALPAGGNIVVSPRGEWAKGHYRWSVKAVDNAGNSHTYSGNFRVGRISGRSRRCTVPNLARFKVAVAHRKLRAAGCRVGRVFHRPSRRVRAGRVMFTQPRAGKKVPYGTKVDLTVARLAAHRR